MGKAFKLFNVGSVYKFVARMQHDNIKTNIKNGTIDPAKVDEEDNMY